MKWLCKKKEKKEEDWMLMHSGQYHHACWVYYCTENLCGEETSRNKKYPSNTRNISLNLHRQGSSSNKKEEKTDQSEQRQFCTSFLRQWFWPWKNDKRIIKKLETYTFSWDLVLLSANKCLFHNDLVLLPLVLNALYRGSYFCIR